DTLTGVETVIVDEVHALAGNKRGAHLAVSLERLDALLEKPAQRIGLSATVRPAEEVARFLGGVQPVKVVDGAEQKRWNITVSVPVVDMTQPAAGASPEENVSMWPHVEARIMEIAAQDRKSTRLNSSHVSISYAVFCLKKKTKSSKVGYVDCTSDTSVD